MEIQTVQAIVELLMQFGFAGVFAYLYMLERKAHEETRRVLIETLREIAGLRAALIRPQYVSPDDPTTPSRRVRPVTDEERARFNQLHPD